jgi:hypothetical protein
MRFSLTPLVVLAASIATFAAPLRAPGKRAASDIVVFTFADVLEQFESQFYQAALGKFQEADFTTAGIASPALAIEQFQNIQKDEATHSVVLQAALKAWGAEPLTTCQFDFTPGLTDVATMLATARIVEQTGVSAYLGGATLLTDPVILTAGGSILAVEARHSTVLNILGGTGKSVDSPFDIAMTPSEVLAIAGPFISGCSLDIPANPVLSITASGAAVPGARLSFTSPALNGTTTGFHCQMIVGGATFAIALPIDECIVPDGVSGAVLIFITSDGNPLANNVRDRDTIKLVAGPNYVFVDTTTELLGSSARQGSGVASSGESTTTSTITPSQASDILAGATSSVSGVAGATDSVSSDIAGATGTASSDIAGATGTVSSDASSTDSAVGAASTGIEPVGNAGAAPAAPPVSTTPNLETGPSADGRINVEGWSSQSQ